MPWTRAGHPQDGDSIIEQQERPLTAAEHDREASGLYNLAISARYRFLFGREAASIALHDAERHAQAARKLRDSNGSR